MHTLETLALIPLTIAAACAPAVAYGMPYGWEWGWGHWPLGGLLMLALWGGLIALLVLVVRWLWAGPAGGATTTADRKTPRQILEERFARGEIDKEELEERKRALGV